MIKGGKDEYLRIGERSYLKYFLIDPNLIIDLPDESSSSRVSTSQPEGIEQRANLSDSEETTTDMSSPTTSEQGVVVPWSEGVTVETGKFYEKLSSSKNKGRLITANLIRSKCHSFNFSLEDEKSDIILKFSMKGYGLIISFVPYLGPCDEGYIIHFQEQGEITFNKHGMKIELSDDENRYDPSKKLNFILNTACKKVVLMEVDGDNHKKPLLRYTPVHVELCSYVVISAHENSDFDMVLFPLR
ncbi:hypothetical protein HOLleu_22311 [Holothuria leucospilota]|uniref:Uncharacterized protein n=1 Tax=Holothuria leucospilota TaxID=206669 RepID=A0A9Q1BYB4_HOLLE|nr:hypothetical protein HOLleu_22311 [Holothuria leucospilota]